MVLEILKKIVLLILSCNFLISENFDINKIKNYSAHFKHVNDSKILNSSIDNSTYLLGAGDKVAINFLANDIMINNILTISPSNDIIIPSIGMINIKGMSVEVFIDTIKKMCKKKFDIFELSITLTDIRKFNISVMGFDNNIYNYSVTHVTTVADLLNNIKKTNSELFKFISERYVTLKRKDITYNVDLLKYNSLLKGYNPYLLENDVLILSKKERFFEVVGEVKNPGLYEYTPGESISDVIELSGGVTFSADSSFVTILRYEGNSIVKFNTDSYDFKSYNILPDDYVLISKNKKIKNLNYVYIYGEILNPGKYPVSDDNTILDVIEFADGFTVNADSTKILINNDFIKKNVDVEFLRINNILPQNRNLSEISYYKSRLMLDRGTTRSFNSNATENILSSKVNNNDFIYIPSNVASIEILGAINAPGNYSYMNGLSTLDYINKSGQLTNLSNGNYYVINANGVKKQIDLKFSDFKSGDIIFIEQKADLNRWVKFKEMMSVLGQIATILVVVKQ